MLMLWLTPMPAQVRNSGTQEPWGPQSCSAVGRGTTAPQPGMEAMREGPGRAQSPQAIAGLLPGQPVCPVTQLHLPSPPGSSPSSQRAGEQSSWVCCHVGPSPLPQSGRDRVPGAGGWLLQGKGREDACAHLRKGGRETQPLSLSSSAPESSGLGFPPAPFPAGAQAGQAGGCGGGRDCGR